VHARTRAWEREKREEREKKDKPRLRAGERNRGRVERGGREEGEGSSGRESPRELRRSDARENNVRQARRHDSPLQ